MALPINPGIAKALLAGINLATAAFQGAQAAKQGVALVERWVAEGRDPTDAEWAQLNAVSDDLDRQIAEQRDRLMAMGANQG